MTASSLPIRNPRFAYLDLVAVGYSLYGVGAVSPFLRDRLALSDAQTGLHSTSMAIGIVAAGFFASRLDRRWDPRAVHVGAIALMAVAWIGIAWAPAFVVTLAAAAGIGLGSGIVLGHANAVLGATGGARARERLARANVWAIAAALAAPLVVAASASLGIGWQGGLWPALVVLILAAAASRSVAGTDEPLLLGGGRLPAAYWRGWLLVVLVVAVEFSIVFWGATLVARRTDTTTADATLVAASFLAGMVGGRLTLSSKVVSALDPHRLVAAGLGLAITGAVLVWASSVVLVSAIGLFGAGLGVAVLYPLGVSLALEASDGNLPVAGARLTIASGAAILTAPFVLGAMSDALGVVAGWWLVIALGAAGLSVAGFVRRDGRRRAALAAEPALVRNARGA